jgi:hypothetical protein
VLVGGLAVLLRGHVRLTIDADLIVDLEPVGARGAVEAALASGFRPVAPVDPFDFADPAKRAEWIHEKGLTVFSWFHQHDPLHVLDYFVSHPTSFPELWARAEQLEFRRTGVRVAAISDLVALKRRAGRPQDLEDIARLEEIARRTREGER